MMREGSCLFRVAEKDRINYNMYVNFHKKEEI